MKISLFTDTFLPQMNGVSMTLNRLIHHLQHRNISHQVFVPEFAEQDLFANNIHRFFSLPFYLYPECRIALPNLLAVRQHLNNFQPDLIHIATPFNMGLCGLHYGKKYGIPLVSSYHTHFDRYLDYYHLRFAKNWIWRYLRWFHESTELTLVPSQETKDLLRKQDFTRLDLWKRGVDSDLFHPKKRSNELREHYQIGNRLLVLFVGRMAPEKDLDILLEVMCHLPQEIKERIHWMFVGDGPLLAKWQEFNLPQATFTGYLEGEQLAKVYSSADLFVFPSSTETFGNVVLEAAASGIPAIGANAGGVEEIIQDGATGFLCPPRNPEAFTQALVQFLEKPALLRQMGKEARRYAITQSWEAIFDRLLLQYEQVIHNKRRKVG